MQHSKAHALIQKSLSLAASRQVEIAVALTDDHGELIAYSKMDGAAFHAGVLAQNKAYTAARDRQATQNLAAWANETGKDLGYWSDAKFTGIAGGVPIIEHNRVIGAIGISGLSEEDDHEFAESVVNEH